MYQNILPILFYITVNGSVFFFKYSTPTFYNTCYELKAHASTFVLLSTNTRRSIATTLYDKSEHIVNNQL